MSTTSSSFIFIILMHSLCSVATISRFTLVENFVTIISVTIKASFVNFFKCNGNMI